MRNIASPDPLEESLMRLGAGRRIEIYFNMPKKTFEHFLESISVSVNKCVIYEDRCIASIWPIYISVPIVYSPFPDLGTPELTSKKLSTNIDVPNFEGSDEFYTKVEKNKHVWIVRDDYSSERAQVLYQYVREFEELLRKKYAESVGYENVEKPNHNYDGNKIDHQINKYDLFNDLREKLLEPCSDTYFEDQINKKRKTPIEARKLTKLDELNIPIDSGEFRRISNIRNAVMHFRVVTFDDVICFINSISRLKQAHMLDRLYRQQIQRIDDI